jgi:ceramide glucosyltransferase
MTLVILYGVVCAAMLVIMLFLYGYSIHLLWLTRRHTLAPERTAWPKVALIVPCRGLEPNLEENLRRHFSHDYPDYQIVFTVANADDAAVPIIRKLIESEPGRLSTLVIAPMLPDCVEKVSNQIAAFGVLTAAVEVIVCGDSDGLIRDGCWLRSLVAALERCSLISGFRWYIPRRPSLAGYLHSAWDSNWLLLHALGKTTWGGAMAFTKDTYTQLGFEESLRCAITDDLVLQVRTHAAGERTGFTPGGMMIGEPHQRLVDFYHWAIRQSQFVRIVTPWLWLMGFGTANVYACFFGLSLALFFIPNLAAWHLPATALGLAALFYLGRGYLDYRIVRNLFPGHADKTTSLRWVYYWANPLVDLLAVFVAYASFFSNTIRWRGISYRIRRRRVIRC